MVTMASDERARNFFTLFRLGLYIHRAYTRDMTSHRIVTAAQLRIGTRVADNFTAHATATEIRRNGPDGLVVIRWDLADGGRETEVYGADAQFTVLSDDADDIDAADAADAATEYSWNQYTARYEACLPMCDHERHTHYTRDELASVTVVTVTETNDAFDHDTYTSHPMPVHELPAWLAIITNDGATSVTVSVTPAGWHVPAWWPGTPAL